MAAVFFCGCSFTRGEGFDQDQRHLCFPALVSQSLGYDCENHSVAGWSNFRIFMRSVEALQSGDPDCDIYVIQWTGLNRLFLHPGPDRALASNDRKYPDFQHEHRGISLSAREKSQFCDLLTLLNGDYQNILDLVTYCNVLAALAQSRQKTICFVNGLLPWTRDLITIDIDRDDLTASLSKHSQSMLELESRDNQQVIVFLRTLQTRLNTLDWSLWVNPWQSMYDLSQDRGPLGHHPGINSHAVMAEMIYNHLKTKAK